MDLVASQIIEIGAVATALIAILVLVRRALKPLRKMHYFLDDWFGTPARPGVDARPGVMGRLDAIEHELHPNSSMSMRDAVDRIEKAVAIAPKIEAIATAVEADPKSASPGA